MSSQIDIQYDLFDPRPTEMSTLKMEMESLKASQDNVRKGLFARHNEMMKLIMQLDKELSAVRNQLELVAKNRK